MKILVVGCGFIGHHIINALTDHEVYILTRSQIPTWRQEHWRSHIKDIVVDQAETVYMPFRNTEFDCVIYTASTANARRTERDLVQHSPGFIQGPINVLENVNTKHFLMLSSSMVYGHFDGVPTETAALNPIDPYGMLKASGEQLLKFYCKKYDMPYTIIRPSAVYGPGDYVLRVISKFLLAAHEDDTLNVKGDAALDFTYVKDLAQGILLAVQTDKSHNETFNMTYGEAVPLFAAANMCIKEVQRGQIETTEADTLYPERGALDITKARQLLGYNPTIDLKQGIHEYYLQDWGQEPAPQPKYISDLL